MSRGEKHWSAGYWGYMVVLFFGHFQESTFIHSKRETWQEVYESLLITSGFKG